jgi:hypothetical protein
MKLAVTPAFGWFWIARTASLTGDYAFRVGFITYLIAERTSRGDRGAAGAGDRVLPVRWRAR